MKLFHVFTFDSWQAAAGPRLGRDEKKCGDVNKTGNNTGEGLRVTSQSSHPILSSDDQLQAI